MYFYKNIVILIICSSHITYMCVYMFLTVLSVLQPFALDDCAFCEEAANSQFAYYRARKEYCRHQGNFPCCITDNNSRIYQDKMYLGLNVRQNKIMDGRKTTQCSLLHAEMRAKPHYCRDALFTKVHPSSDFVPASSSPLFNTQNKLTHFVKVKMKNYEKLRRTRHNKINHKYNVKNGRTLKSKFR